MYVFYETFQRGCPKLAIFKLIGGTVLSCAALTLHADVAVSQDPIGEENTSFWRVIDTFSTFVETRTVT